MGPWDGDDREEDVDCIDAIRSNFLRWNAEYCNPPRKCFLRSCSKMSSSVHSMLLFPPPRFFFGGAVTKYKRTLVPTSAPTWIVSSCIMVGWIEIVLTSNRPASVLKCLQILQKTTLFRLDKRTTSSTVKKSCVSDDLKAVNGQSGRSSQGAFKFRLFCD